jgi:hypothetical protein
MVEDVAVPDPRAGFVEVDEDAARTSFGGPDDGGSLSVLGGRVVSTQRSVL